MFKLINMNLVLGVFVLTGIFKQAQRANRRQWRRSAVNTNGGGGIFGGYTASVIEAKRGESGYEYDLMVVRESLNWQVWLRRKYYEVLHSGKEILLKIALI